MVEFAVVNDAESLVVTFRATVEFTSAGFVQPAQEIHVSRHRTSAYVTTLEIILLLHFVALLVAEMFECQRGWPASQQEMAEKDAVSGPMWYAPKREGSKPYGFAYRQAGYYGPGYYRLSELQEFEQGGYATEANMIGSGGVGGVGGARVLHTATATATADPIPHILGSRFRWPRYLLNSWFNAHDMLHSLLLLCFAFTVGTKIVVLSAEAALRAEVSAAVEAAAAAGMGLSEHIWFPAQAFHLARAANVLRFAVGLLLFLSCIELLFKLSFLHGVAVFLRIIERMILKLRSFTLVVICILLAFGLMAWVLFGNHVAVYNTIPMAMLELVGGASINGLPAWPETHAADRITATVFHLLFVIFFFFLLTNLLIAVMTEGYEAVRERSSRVWAFVQFVQLKDQIDTGGPRRSALRLVCCCCRCWRERRRYGGGVDDRGVGDEEAPPSSKALFQTFAAEIRFLEAGRGAQDRQNSSSTEISNKRYVPTSRIGKTLVAWLNETRRRRRRRMRKEG